MIGAPVNQAARPCELAKRSRFVVASAEAVRSARRGEALTGPWGYRHLRGLSEVPRCCSATGFVYRLTGDPAAGRAIAVIG